MTKIKAIIALMRPHQWLKNMFIFLPLFFGGRLLDAWSWQVSLVAFISFSSIASSIYCFNDIFDVEADRLHPQKKTRPLASGIINKHTSYLIMVLLLLVAVLVTVFFGGEHQEWELAILFTYYIMNLCYTVKLKHYPLIDVFIIALGFVLRVVIGGVSAQVILSHWIVLMTFLLALFLGFAKRRDDVLIYQTTGIEARKKVKRYNLELVNLYLTILAGIIVVSYIMYTVSDEVIKHFHNQYLYVTAAFVLFGIFRYLQITLVDHKSGSPTKVLMKDFVIQFCILAWVLTFAMIIYVL